MALPLTLRGRTLNYFCTRTPAIQRSPLSLRSFVCRYSCPLPFFFDIALS